MRDPEPLRSMGKTGSIAPYRSSPCSQIVLRFSRIFLYLSATLAHVGGTVIPVKIPVWSRLLGTLTKDDLYHRFRTALHQTSLRAVTRSS
jgi:hypothetical protein